MGEAGRSAQLSPSGAGSLRRGENPELGLRRAGRGLEHLAFSVSLASCVTAGRGVGGQESKAWTRELTWDKVLRSHREFNNGEKEDKSCSWEQYMGMRWPRQEAGGTECRASSVLVPHSRPEAKTTPQSAH